MAFSLPLGFAPLSSSNFKVANKLDVKNFAA